MYIHIYRSRDKGDAQMVVATDRELGRCGHVMHGSPKLFNRLKLAQALHILQPVLHPAALAALL